MTFANDRSAARVTIALLSLASSLFAAVPAAAQTGTVVEYVNKADFTKAPGGLFFYSADPSEQLGVDRGGAGQFFRTGRTFAAGGATPVCRFYGSVTPGPNSHFFTVDPGECAGLKAAQVVPTPATVPQWNFEGNGFNTTVTTKTPSEPSDQATSALSCPAGTTMVLRTYNNAFGPTGAKNPWDSNHRFVRSQADINSMVALGWKDEGGVFCAPTSSTALRFQSNSALKGLCVAPRADPQYGDTKGNITSEKAWAQSYVWDTYLWYNELPDINPASYATPTDFFDDYQTYAKLPSGQYKDRFHFWYTTDEWNALINGTQSGYGFQIAIESSAPPRAIYVVYTEPNSPAGMAGVGRGAKILTVDGEDVTNGNNIDKLNAGLFPSVAGESHTFRILDVNSSTPRTVTLVSADVQVATVPVTRTIDTPTGRVGYILFNDHFLPAEGELMSAVQQLASANVTDLVLDLRYNGGGYLFIAAELAYMIAGPAATKNKIMERETYSDKRAADTNSPDSVTPFWDTASGYPGTNTTQDAPLPFLNLKRLYVLTSAGTASASEAIINGLQGIDIPVIRIGTTTYGKPYGFAPQDNCAVTYFSVEFKGANNKGFADYDDGFAPTCTVADDYTHELGDANEKRLAAALYHRANGACPAGTGDSALKASLVEPTLVRTPGRENRYIGPRINGHR